MKTRKIFYTIIGNILVVLNLLFDIAEFRTRRSPKEDCTYSIGYFVGSHILLIVGLILLRIAHNLQKKLKKKQVQEIIDSIGNS
jgi:hypothetical protein